MRVTKDTAACLICLGMCAVLIAAVLHPWHDWGGDFSSYIMQAQAICRGNLAHFMQENRSAILESSISLGPVAYPWGYPLLLAPFYALWGANLLPLKSIGVIFLLLSLWMMKKLFENRLTPPFLLLLLACFALNKNYYIWANQILSDIPFLFFTLASLFFIDRIFFCKRRVKALWLDSFFLSLCIFAAFSIRLNGIALLATLLIMQYFYWFRPHNKLCYPSKIFLAAFPYVLFFFLFIIWQAYFPYGGGTEASRLKNISLRDIFYNMLYYSDLLKTFIPLQNETASFFFYLATVPFFIYGLARKSVGSLHFIAFSTINLAIYLVWPAIQGYRFLFPLIPIYIYFVLCALEAISNKYFFLSSNALFVIVILLVVSYFMITIKKDIPEAKCNQGTPYSEAANEMFSYIRRQTPTDSTILFFKPRVLRMLTQRKSFFIDKSEEIRGDYICAYKGKQWGPNFISLEALATLKDSGKLIKLFENSEFVFFKIEKAS